VFSLRNAERVLVKNCHARWGSNRQSYFGPALEAENVKELKIEHFDGIASDPARDKALVIS
jgi:hypothetical protein